MDGKDRTYTQKHKIIKHSKYKETNFHLFVLLPQLKVRQDKPQQQKNDK